LCESVRLCVCELVVKVVDPAQTKNLLVSTMRPLAVIIQAPFFCVIRHHCVSAEGGGGG